jgi:hypothetical protein
LRPAGSWLRRIFTVPNINYEAREVDVSDPRLDVRHAAHASVESHFTESETPVGQIASFGASGIVAIGDGVTRATVLHFQCSDRDLTGDSSDSVSAAIRDAFRPGWKH